MHRCLLVEEKGVCGAGSSRAEDTVEREGRRNVLQTRKNN
jgi:hypothetical protein